LPLIFGAPKLTAYLCQWLFGGTAMPSLDRNGARSGIGRAPRLVKDIDLSGHAILVVEDDLS